SNIEVECGIDNFGISSIPHTPDRLRPNKKDGHHLFGGRLKPRRTPRATSSQRVKPTVSQSEMELVPTTTTGRTEEHECALPARRRRNSVDRVDTRRSATPWKC